MYRHTQRAPLVLGAVLIGALIVLLVLTGVMADPAGRTVLLIVGALMLAAVWLFSSLTITVDADRLAWRFGPGLIRKAVPIDTVVHAERTRTSWLAGWGIHWTPRGWLYNVAGLDAVLVRLSSGQQFLLGTDDPDGLVAALDAVRQVPTAG